jgi:hypothetical protein
LTSVSLGQIKLVEQNLQTWVGFESPQIVNGVVVAGPNSKPILASTSQTILVKSQVEYKSISLLVQKLPTLERIEIDAIEGGYRFKPGTSEGLYNIVILASDPGTGLDTLTVLHKPSVGPIDPVKPEPPTDEVERVVFNSMLELRKGYGSAFRAAASAIERREVTVDAKLQSFLEPLTRSARTNAMTGVDGLIQAKLPRDVDKLKPEAARFIESIGLAFERSQ